MIISNSCSNSIKVDYIVNAADAEKKIDLLPSTHRIELVDVSASPLTAGVSKIDVELDGSSMRTYTATGTAGATSIVGAVQNVVVPSNRTYSVAKGGVAVGSNNADIIITTGTTPLPSSLIGAAVQVTYSGADPQSLILPKVMFVADVATNTAIIKLQGFGGIATSVAASGLIVLNSAAIRRNVPVNFTSMAVTGDSATITGSFPTNVVGSAIVLSNPVGNKLFVASVRGKSTGYTFPIKSQNVKAGTITITGVKGLLQTVATAIDGDLFSAEIDKIAGHSQGEALSNNYYDFGTSTPLNLSSMRAGSEIKVIQYLRGS